MRIQNINKIILLGAVSVGLAACHGDGEYDSYSYSTTTTTTTEVIVDAPLSTTDIAGLYDISVDTQMGYDEYYLYLDEFGNGTVYDYAGDSYDNYGNCYWITRDVIQVYHLYDDVFDTGVDTPSFEVELKYNGFNAVFDQADGVSIEKYFFAENVTVHDMEISECEYSSVKSYKTTTEKIKTQKGPLIFGRKIDK
ncbi:hypothetical protein [Teredinibacter sp. KSP-S5-2]|uniref:hypothetical protein n=1 Tax=Teredinibacter sp. KSP-S5-2 TaxID=3034506 RepID=UPI002934FB7B|nr:hypothetical protein [Teredinibacter sp. KSP-S5-2]WNO08408.1 hypothetical protein P5V12_15670 [Teredinibacter sp. KSP-S5-2]